MRAAQYDVRAKKIPAAWESPIHSWEIALKAAGRADTTIYTRLDHVKRLARALRGQPFAVSGAEILAWAGTQEWSNETRRSVYASIRGFYSWAFGAGLVKDNPALVLPTVKPAFPAPRPASDMAYQVGMQTTDARVRLILKFAAEMGMRRKEIALIHTRDLQEDMFGMVLRCHGKGNKLRVLPIPEDLARKVSQANGYLFPGNDNGHLSPRYVGKLATKALPGDWTLHTLRHRFATKAYASTSDLIAIQQLLGHASAATTQRYVAIDSKRLREVATAAAS